MSTSSSNSSDGNGLTLVLFVVFLVLKLTGIINWSWWWATSPLWIPFGMILTGFLLFVLVFGTSALIEYLIEYFKKQKGE